MQKTKFIFQETLKLNHAISVQGEDKNIEAALKDIERNERNCDFDKLSLYFKKNGCKVLEAEEEESWDRESIEYYDEEDISEEYTDSEDGCVIL